MNDRKILNGFEGDAQWHEAASELLVWGWDIEAQAEHYGEQLLYLVNRKNVGVKELRQGVIWANALDKEAVERSDGMIDSLAGDDRIEAYARRICHHAGKYALGRVKNHRKRLILGARSVRMTNIFHCAGYVQSDRVTGIDVI